MAQDIVNKNQDISYTNLDFSSIYTEVVDLAKQLSYRWDPSISDESDPGVVLLKLSALIADKMNYNIDKSALEAFPLSVTQEDNARQLYEQLGYYMNWYESATVPINLSWIGSTLSSTDMYTIPRFTVITDAESSRSYALIGTMNSTNLVVSDGKLACDGSTLQMVAIEGTPTTFSFLGETTITSQMVDEKNRLYFETKYVSQNGIFIRNIGNDQDNYSEWKRVNNLYEQPYSDLRYKFGVDSNSDVAYIEFPDNYAELIGSGIEIVYMIIDPEFYNIPPKTLDRFLVPFSPVENVNVTLSLDNVSIENLYSASGHMDVETIDQAYTNYKRTVGTFKTLITLRDYLNYILLEGKELSSNGFVTDRSNDPQLSYKIMSTVNGMDSLITEIESDVVYTKENPEDATEEFKELRTPKLTPFSLKFYLLQDVIAVNSKTTFEQTFEMIQSDDLPSLSALIDDTAHIQHTYEDILSPDDNKYVEATSGNPRDPNKSYYYKLTNSDGTSRYEFISDSYYMVTTDTVAQENKTYYAYNEQYGIYYVSNVAVGDSVVGLYELVDGDDVTNLIGNGWYEISIPALSQHIAYFRAKYPINMTISTYSVVGADVQADIKSNILTALYSGLNSSQIEFGDKIELDYLTEIVLASDTRIRTVVFDNIEYRIEAIYYNSIRGFVGVILPTEIQSPIYSNYDSVTAYNIAKEIVAKSILSGTTKLIDEDTQFEYHLDQESLLSDVVDDVYSIKSETVIDMESAQKTILGSYTSRNYTLKENEVLTLFRPKLTDIQSFEDGVHYEYLINSDVEGGTSYRLSKTEYIILYTSILDSNENISGYTSRVFTNGAVVHPSFTLLKQDKQSYLSEYFRTQLQPIVYTGDEYEYEFTTNSSYWTGYIMNNSSIINNVITGSEDITLQTMNAVTILPSDGYKFYWKLNNERKSESTGKKYYQLFGSYDPEEEKSFNSVINTYTLKSGESLYYTDKDGKNLAILHEGTTITRNCGINVEYTDVDQSELYSFIPITTDGVTIISDENFTPVDAGYYEKVGQNYVLTSDTSVDQQKTYYVLVMNSMVGYYENSGGTLSPSPSITYDVFENAEISQSDLSDISPFNEGWYEQVNYSGIVIEDTYSAAKPTSGDPQVDSEDTSISRPRYKKSTATTLINPVVYDTMYNEFEVNDVNTYPVGTDAFNSIDINSSNASVYSPMVNGLYEVEVSSEQGSSHTPEYYDFYYHWETTYDYVNPTGLERYYPIEVHQGYTTYAIQVEEFTGSTFTENVKYFTRDSYGGYDQTADTTPNAEKTYYTITVLHVGEHVENIKLDELNENPIEVTVNSIPTVNNWYEKDGEEYKPTTKIYSYKPTYVESSSSQSPFIEVSSSSVGDGYQLYYKVGSSDTSYLKRNLHGKYIPLSNSFNSVSEQLFSRCQAIKYSISAVATIELDQVNLNWNAMISSKLPSEFLYRKFSDASSGVTTDYQYVSESNLFSKISSVQEYIASDFIFPIVRTSGSTTTVGYAVPKTLCDNAGLSADGYLDIGGYATINNAYLNAWYNLVEKLGGEAYANNVILYLEPTYYRFRYLTGVDLSNYYILKEYADKDFAPVDPWECDVITSDDIVNSPINTLGSLWKPVQDNCSISIRENDSYSLTEGDTISVTSKYQVRQDDNEVIKYPVFSNTETILNLNNYDISYTKSTNEVVYLENITIAGTEWRGYSNLLVNTSTDSGQTLEENHSIVCYDESSNVVLTVSSNAEADVVIGDEPVLFQLQYPVNNQAGSDIRVITYDSLGNEIPNSVYVYNKLQSGNGVTYSSTHDTQISFSSGTLELPFLLPVGEYLIPLNGKDGKDLKATLSYTMGGETITTQIHNFSNDADTSEEEIFNKDKTYFLYVVVPTGAEDAKITFTSNVGNEFVLGDAFKFVKRYVDDNGDDALYNDIFTQMKRFDTNQIYNYVYQPDENDLIENPLDPKMFWNKNHIFNKNTIAQLDTSSASNLGYRFITSR